MKCISPVFMIFILLMLFSYFNFSLLAPSISLFLLDTRVSDHLWYSSSFFFQS